MGSACPMLFSPNPSWHMWCTFWLYSRNSIVWSLLNLSLWHFIKLEGVKQAWSYYATAGSRDRRASRVAGETPWTEFKQRSTAQEFRRELALLWLPFCFLWNCFGCRSCFKHTHTLTIFHLRNAQCITFTYTNVNKAKKLKRMNESPLSKERFWLALNRRGATWFRVKNLVRLRPPGQLIEEINVNKGRRRVDGAHGVGFGRQVFVYISD